MKKYRITKPKIKQPVSRLSVVKDTLAAKTLKAQVKDHTLDLKHKQKMNKLVRQKEANEIRAKKVMAKPKHVIRREKAALARQISKNELELKKAKLKDGWRNTLATGVVAQSNIKELKNEDDNNIQEEIAKALAGPNAYSV